MRVSIAVAGSRCCWIACASDGGERLCVASRCLAVRKREKERSFPLCDVLCCGGLAVSVLVLCAFVLRHETRFRRALRFLEFFELNGRRWAVWTLLWDPSVGLLWVGGDTAVRLCGTGT